MGNWRRHFIMLHHTKMAGLVFFWFSANTYNTDTGHGIKNFVRRALVAQQCCWEAVFDLSAWGPNLLKLDCECLVSASGPVCGRRGIVIAAADRRPQKANRCYGAALDAEDENQNHNVAVMAVSKSPGWSAVCFHSVSAALTASHTTSSLG